MTYGILQIDFVVRTARIRATAPHCADAKLKRTFHVFDSNPFLIKKLFVSHPDRPIIGATPPVARLCGLVLQ